MDDSRQVDVLSLIEQSSRNRLQIWILISSLALMFIEGYDMQVMAFVAPTLIKSWHIDKRLFGPAISIGLIGYLFGSLAVSVCSDYFGRKITIVSATLVFGAFTLATAFATSLSQLFALRLIAGVGLGGMIPALIALNAEYVPAARRGTRVSLLYIGYGSGATVCGFLPWLDWSDLFKLGGTLALVAGLVALVALPESLHFLIGRKAAPRRVAAILRRLKPGMAFEASDRFVLPEEHQAGMPIGLLFSQGRAVLTILLWLAFALSLLTHIFLTSWLPTLLADSGLPLREARAAGGVFFLGSLAGTAVIGVLIDRKGIGSLTFAFLFSIPLIIAIGFSLSSEVLLMAIVFLTGGALIGGQAGLSAYSGSLYPTAMRSTGVGWALGVGRLGAIAGPTVGGFLLSTNMTVQWLLILASLPVLCCAGALFLIGRRPRTVWGGHLPELDHPVVPG